MSQAPQNQGCSREQAVGEHALRTRAFPGSDAVPTDRGPRRPSLIQRCCQEDAESLTDLVKALLLPWEESVLLD